MSRLSTGEVHTSTTPSDPCIPSPSPSPYTPTPLPLSSPSKTNTTPTATPTSSATATATASKYVTRTQNAARPRTTTHIYLFSSKPKPQLGPHPQCPTRARPSKPARNWHCQSSPCQQQKHKRRRSTSGTAGVKAKPKRRRMDSALPSPSPSPSPPPRDTWAEYRDVVANAGISMLSPTDVSPANPRSYVHRRESEAMDALWARPFDVRRFAAQRAGGVERASRLPDINQRLAMRGCQTHRDDELELEELSSFNESGEDGGEGDAGDQSRGQQPSTPEYQQPTQEGPFWFAPPLVARYSRGAPYTLQRCRARHALSDLLRSPFGNQHFRLNEDTTVRRSTLRILGLAALPSATTLAAGAAWRNVLDQWPEQAEGLAAMAQSVEHAGVPALLRAMGPAITPAQDTGTGTGSRSASPMETSSSENERMGSRESSVDLDLSETAMPFFFVKDADTSSLADAKAALLVSMRASLAIVLRLVDHARAGGGLRALAPDSAGQAFGLLQNGEAWELYMMHHSPLAPTPYTVTRLWHGRMDVAVDVVTLQTLCANILASVDERVAYTVECLRSIHRTIIQRERGISRGVPGIVIDRGEGGSADQSPGPGASAVASAGASAQPFARRSGGGSSTGSGVRSCVSPSAEFHIGLYRAGELTVEDRYERIANWVSETSECFGLRRLLQM